MKYLLLSLFCCISLFVHAEGPFPLDKMESLVPGEEKATKKLIELFSQHMKRNYDRPGKQALRAVHSKGHGCLNAEFEVLDHKDAALKYSVFSEPRKYRAFIRYSNGDGPPAKDSDDLVSLGMAFKIVDAETPQDFLMINQPAFLVKDIVEFAEVIKAREGGFLKKGLFAFKFRDSLRFRRKAHPKDDPLNTTFWSALAFRLGDTAIKYIARPCNPRPKSANLKLSENYISELLKGHIAKEDACFDFFLQKRLLNGKEDTEMPIENARIIWDEEKSVPIRVAQLRIPKQALEDKQKACEESEFSPWNTSHDLRPLGNLNRIRKVVYDLSAKERARINR